ncbi:hypothetical protein PSTT_05869 [Puccinia striiformis]|uniref:Uncharacterized protein n=1 Tax=Puccinia striiformis TaxID=27350 RepID=A0A2S4VMS6_9BASI|nr:hypothetical protein PSTT_05869 [Puccinia striiformis]
MVALWPQNQQYNLGLERVKKKSQDGSDFSQVVIESPPEDAEIPIADDSQAATTAPNSTKKTYTADPLSSLIFAFPLPNPAKEYHLAGKIPLFLYTLPRSVYKKPDKDPETGKRPREKITKKLARNWQESVRKGEDIKSGDYANPSWFGRAMGATFRFMAFFLRFMTNSDAQLLARLPSLNKMGRIQVLYSTSVSNPSHDRWPQGIKPAILSSEEVKESIMMNLAQVRRRAKILTIVSGFILPPALAAEIYVPFTFEIALIYFMIQLRGKRFSLIKFSEYASTHGYILGETNQNGIAWRTARFLTNQNAEEIIQPTKADCESENGNDTVMEGTAGLLEPVSNTWELEAFHKINEQIYRTCANIDPHKFPYLVEETPDIETGTTANQEITRDFLRAAHRFPPVAKLKAESCSINPPPGPDAKTCTREVKSILKKHINHKEIANEREFTRFGFGSASGPDTSYPLGEDEETNRRKFVPNAETASDLIKLFQEILPPHVSDRHESNNRRIAEDFNRALKIRMKAYIKSIQLKTSQQNRNIE